jgi:hypothetical protein
MKRLDGSFGFGGGSKSLYPVFAGRDISLLGAENNCRINRPYDSAIEID